MSFELCLYSWIAGLDDDIQCSELFLLRVYYPALGTYSSRSTEVMEDHMQQIQQAGVGRFQAGKVGVREEGGGGKGESQHALLYPSRLGFIY